MADSLMIGKEIYSTLSSDSELTRRLGHKGKIFPIVAEMGADQPFLVYRRESLKMTGSKDGWIEDDVEFSVTVVATEYKQSLEIAQRCRELLQQIRGTVLENAEESFEENSFVQRLVFSRTVTR